jgi:hypothetical protein
VEVDGPVRIAVRLRLVDVPTDPPVSRWHPDGFRAPQSTHAAPPAATGETAESATASSDADYALRAARPDEAGAGPDAPIRPRAARQGLLDFLARLSGTGELSVLTGLLPPVVLHAWYAALTGGAGGRAPIREPDPASVLDHLLSLHRHGELPALLTAVPASTRLAWRHALLRTTGWVARPVVAALARAADAEAINPPADSTQSSRAALATLAALANRIGIPETERLLGMAADAGPAGTAAAGVVLAERGATWSPGEALAPLSTAPVVAADPSIRDAAQRDKGARPAAGADAARAEVQRPLDPPPKPFSGSVDVDLDSALPFLLLGPLARAGYLDAITPAFNVVGLADATAWFAAALAATVLSAGRRPPSAGCDPDVATAFTGLAAPPGPAALNAFANRAGPALTAIDAVLTASLVLGHRTAAPLVLCADGDPGDGRFVLADLDGLFPMTWAGSVDEVLVAWRACDSPALLVAAATARAPVLHELNRAGVRFVVDVPPTRREPWTRLAGPDKAWTNRAGPAPDVDISLLPWAATRLDQLLTRLRPTGRLDAGLSRSVVLAAAFGLGSIAWTLWRDRETTHPLLALDRFGDLSARVRVDAGSVRIRLPLGKRHDDLYHHGWLTDVPNVPWLGGRVVQFSGG